MAYGVLRRVRLTRAAQAPEELHGPALVFQVLAVHERHVEEPALYRRQLPVVGMLHRVPGRLARFLVCGVHPRVTAIHVARELVEDDDERQAASRLVLPVVKVARGGLLVNGLEALPDLTIEPGIFGEPRLPELPIALFALAAEPEAEDLLRRAHYSVRLTTVTSSSPRRVVEGRPSRYEL